MARPLPNSINPRSMVFPPPPVLLEGLIVSSNSLQTLNTGFTSDSRRRLQNLDTNPSSQDTLYFGTSFSSTLAPSQLSLGSSPYEKLHQSYQDIDIESTLDLDTQNIHSESVEQSYPRSPQSFIPNTNIVHESRVSPDYPWNSFDAVVPSMNVPTHQVSPDTRPNKKRPLTDSGYDTHSHRTTRARYSNLSAAPGPVIRGQNSVNDNLPGQDTQRQYLSPGHRRPRGSSLVIPRSPGTLSTVTAAEADQTPNSAPPFYCHTCRKTFDTKSEYTKDMARHDKRFKCDVTGCQRVTEGFATKNDLERHKRDVHKDPNIPQNVWMCSIPDCKDPKKQWQRKDNFKAHVKRMHGDEDIDTVVERSYRGEVRLSSDSPYYHEQSPEDAIEPLSHVRPEHDSQLSNDMFANPYLPSLGTGVNGTMQFDPSSDVPASGPWAEDSDLYGPPRPSSLSQNHSYQQQSPFNPSFDNAGFAPPHSNFLHVSSMRQSDYNLSSSSGLHGSQQGPTSEAILPYQDRHGFQPRDLHMSSQHNMRATYAHTAPPAHDNSDFFQDSINWSSEYGQPAMPASDSGMSNMDPATGAGSWQVLPSSIPTQHSEITDNFPAMLSPTEGQMADGQVHRDRTAEMEQKLQAISAEADSESYLNAQLNSMLKPRQHRPRLADPSKENLIVAPSFEAVMHPKIEERPFECSRDGCTKRFTQQNICRKHEQRHDRLFFCTFDACDGTFGSKADLRRHEERIHGPRAFEGWRCFNGDVPTSQHKPNCFRFFSNKEEFVQHRRDEHRERAAANNGGLKAVKNCHIQQGRPGQFWCGFCNQVIQNDPDENDGLKCEKYRYDHIEHHIKKGNKRFSDWVGLILH